MSKPSPRSDSTTDATPVLSTEERRTLAPELVLDSTLFWEKYKLLIMAGAALLVLGLVGSEIYQSNQNRTAAAASSLLDAAKSEPDFQKVIDTYPGTTAAANAYLLLGRTRADAKNYVGAAQAWQAFVDKFPQHPMVPNALIGQASALEAQGKLDQARALYQRVATAYQGTYTAPLARLGEAGLLLSQRKTREAKQVYEDVMASSPKSFASQLAAQGLKTLNVLPTTAALSAGSAMPAPTAAPAEPSGTAAPTVLPATTLPAPGPSASVAPVPAEGTPATDISAGVPLPVPSVAPAASP